MAIGVPGISVGCRSSMAREHQRGHQLMAPILGSGRWCRQAGAEEAGIFSKHDQPCDDDHLIPSPLDHKLVTQT